VRLTVYINTRTGECGITTTPPEMLEANQKFLGYLTTEDAE